MKSNNLAHKQMKTQGTVAIDDLMLKNQAISIYSADLIFILLDYFHTETLHIYME